MVERVGVALVSYGSREVAIADALLRSREYRVELYIADRLRNVFNVKHAKEHAVIPSLETKEITAFFRKYREKIDFGVVGPEDPIIHGVRDDVERETGIPLICPTRECALEKSKVAQRYLLNQILPEANPKFKVFDPKDSHKDDVRAQVWKWLDELDNCTVVKPDGAARGKGVGVWGDHFTSRKELFEHFLSNFQFGPVIIEEKLEGEESSYMAFCDGQHLARLPETRDNKRAFDGDRGPNTGGMGSYKDVEDWLPFMTRSDYGDEEHAVEKLFKHLRGKTRNTCLLGIPFYVAMMHTAEGVKILEINSRPGDPEMQNILPILKDDFIDLCYAILDGSLTRVEVEPKATVVTYKVPPTYGGKENEYLGDRRVDLREAEDLTKFKRGLRVYPAALELREGDAYALSSRTICTVGIGDDIEEARQISLKGLDAIKGGSLWNRTDIASKKHIQRSIDHMRSLRAAE